MSCRWPGGIVPDVVSVRYNLFARSNLEIGTLMTEISPELLAAYRAERDPQTDKSILCHAPFVSLNFDQSGDVTACCYNRYFVLGTYPAQTVQEIWTSDNARALREAFLHAEEAPGCDLCFHQLKNYNFAGTIMRNFDEHARDDAYLPGPNPIAPRVLEFEISNQCNLECIMCSGHWSSSIRAHRDKLPPLRSPYDRTFVDQIEAFLPEVTTAKFLGGEPFLIKRYYEIWERINRVNPDMELVITTNATILPRRAKELLEKLRANIVVSLDGITAATFEAIRKNACFEDVMANLEYLIAYTQRCGTSLTVAVCPMTHNRRELPTLLEFCAERELYVNFNTLLKPPELSLGGMCAEELAETIENLASVRPAGGAPHLQANQQKWDGLVSELRSWYAEKLAFVKRCSDMEARFREFVVRHPGIAGPWSDSTVLKRLVSPLILAVLSKRERAAMKINDFETLLPHAPVELSKAHQAASTEQLILATHFFCRFIDAVDNHDRTGTNALVEQQLKIQNYIDAQAAERRAVLHRWITERIRLGEIDLLTEWIRALLYKLEFLLELDPSREEGLTLLGERGLDAAACRKIREYFESLIPVFGVFDIDPVPVSLAGQDESGETHAADVDVTPPVRDLDDLGNLMDAMYLFHRCQEPAGDHQAVRRRLDMCVAAVSASGKIEVVCKALGKARRTDVYKGLVLASDEELERNLAEFGPVQ